MISARYQARYKISAKYQARYHTKYQARYYTRYQARYHTRYRDLKFRPMRICWCVKKFQLQFLGVLACARVNA